MKKIISALLICVLAFSLASCGTSAENNTSAEDNTVSMTASEFISVKDIMDKIESEGLLPEDRITLTTDNLLDYYGIESVWVVESAAVQNASGYQDEIIIINASNPSAVRNQLKDHIEYQKEQMKNYSPEQYALLEKCDTVENGNYIALFISDNADRMTEIFNSAF